MNAGRRSLRTVLAALRYPAVIGLLALVSLPATSACNDGTCPVRSERLVFDDSDYGAAGLPVEVRYPGSPDGGRTVADGVFPLIVFGHGYQQSYADYAYVWEALVPRGYIIAFPDKLSASVAIDMDAYAEDLLFIASKMHALAGDRASRYFGRIAEGTAFMGHSTGGGAAIVAASQTGAATTVVALAPLGNLLLTPIVGTSPIVAARNVGAPTLILDAGADCLTPPGAHSRAIYANLSLASESCRVTVIQGDHCGFSDARGPGQPTCVAAEMAACTAGLPLLVRQGPTLGSATQNAVTVAYLTCWLAHHLHGDAAGWTRFVRLLETDGRIAYEQRP